MLTCFYFAIDKTMTKIEEDGLDTNLKSVNFLLLTDESIFKFDKSTSTEYGV